MTFDTQVQVDELISGEDLALGERIVIGGIGGDAERVEIGDNVTIGSDVRIIAPRVYIGDFTVIHNHTTIYGYDEVRIGACTWIGQNAVLNCTAPLSIGAGCTISAYSNIWTHFSGGDPLEGCRYNSRKPASIGADAWIGVQASIAPVNIGARALVLAGSVVTRDVPENTVWGGNPAQDLTGKLGVPYEPKTVEEKYSALCELLREFHRQYAPAGGAGVPLEEDGSFNLGEISVTMTDGPWVTGTSIFDVRDRTYSKLRTAEEVAFMKFLLPLIKFYPRN